MTTNVLKSILIDARQKLPLSYAIHLLTDEHFDLLVSRLHSYQQQTLDFTPLPYFKDECTPNSQVVFEQFDPFFTTPNLTTCTAILGECSIDDLLLLLGQRRTSATLLDGTGLPPSRTQLISSATKIHAQHLSVCGRALAKHTHRNTNSFWGIINGNDKNKSQLALAKVEYILDNQTWWNVFFHYKHQAVFEARVASGHGVRWANGGAEFIGFLEEFIN